MKQTLIYWFEYQNKKWEKMNAIQRICPCCREVVQDILFNKRSIFDIDITVCNLCAHNEKAMPSFNWILETGALKKHYLEEVIKCE